MSDVQLVERARRGWGLVLKQDETQAVRALLALLSGAAAAIHFSVAGEHLTVWWLHGAFFVAVAWAQALFAVLILVHPGPLVLQASILGNGLVIATWAASRTVGIPIGPTAGLPEVARLEDVTVTVFEILLVAGCLALLSGRVPARRLSAPVVAGGLLLTGAAVVFTSAALVSAASGGHHVMPGGQHMTGLAHVGTGGSDHHSGTPISANDPVVIQLRGSLESGGTTAALDKLEQLSGQNGRVLSMAHQYVHELGRMVYTSYTDPAQAFSSCDQRFESGCYHGVLQGYFEEHPNFTGPDIARLCGGVAGAGSTTNLHFQCIHGLGHGLTLFFNHNLLRPLRFCDYLDASWAPSCYGGVFMENIVWSQSPESERSAAPGETVIEDDPHYPCNSVADKYRWECYAMQSSVILHLNGWDFEGAFAECDNAPRKYVSTCYYSMGRDIAGYAQHDPVESRRLCLLSEPPNRVSCFIGAAKTLVNLSGSADRAFVLCRHAPRDSKTRCYEAIGEMVSAQSNDRAFREEECAKAFESLGEELCRKSALV